jgi:predicted ATPase
MLRGWARVALGDLEDGLAELRWGLDGYIASGARIALAYYMGVLAEAQLQDGRPGECLESVSAALGEISTRGFCYEAELHRLAGFVLIKQGNERDGKARLRRSLEIARGQKALSLELRTATTMAQVARPSRERSEARILLAGVRARMEGGSKTPDVREASRLVNGS